MTRGLRRTVYASRPRYCNPGRSPAVPFRGCGLAVSNGRYCWLPAGPHHQEGSSLQHYGQFGTDDARFRFVPRMSSCAALFALKDPRRSHLYGGCPFPGPATRSTCAHHQNVSPRAVVGVATAAVLPPGHVGDRGALPPVPKPRFGLRGTRLRRKGRSPVTATGPRW